MIPPDSPPRHFGVLCPPISGHLNPMMTLCRELQDRGHRVTFYLLAYGRKKAEGAGFTVHVFGEDVLPASATTDHLRKLGELSGRKALDHTRDFFATTLRAALRDVPAMLKAHGVDTILADQTATEGPTIAEAIKLPYFIICNALTLYRDPVVPPFFRTWPYRDGVLGRLRNRAGEWVFDVVRRPITRILNEHRQSIGLAPYHSFMSPFPPLAHVSQQPREFEFPRKNPPANLHYVGPMHDARVREASDFPFDRLDGRPLVYASMGTLQNRVRETFGLIAQACADLPVQLVISLGGGAPVETLGKLPGDPIAVGFAPQLELLKRCTLCITHAGLNTVLEALSLGVPLVTVARWLMFGGGAVWRADLIGNALLQTVVLSVAGAAMTTLAAMPMAWLAVRSRTPLTRGLEAAHYYVGAIPGVVVALALVTVTVHTLRPLYETNATLITAYLLLFLPLALTSLRASIAQAPRELEWAAMALGRTPLRAVMMTMRLAAPGVAASLVLVGLGVGTELTATLLLSPNGTETLATRFWDFSNELDSARAAPYALLMVILSLPLTVMLMGRSRRSS
jgi:zeaxanthin glucosyltransferase